jgi:uncharacterized MAPEG superfamily protein
MSTELYWLILTAFMTSLLWIPYVLNRMKVMGLNSALVEMGADQVRHDQWGNRSRAAHANAVENFVIFGAAVLALHVLGAGTGVTAIAVQVYFYARLAHFFFHTFGVPYLRTLSFFAAWLATMAVILTVLGWI